MTFKIDGREYKSYELSNEQILRLYKDETLSPEEKEEVTRMLVNSFEYHLCPNAGENEDDVFVRFFSNFVNGRMRDKRYVADRLSCQHRYLQGEMFKVCMAFIEKLDRDYISGNYDGRNEYACRTANIIVKAIRFADHSC